MWKRPALLLVVSAALFGCGDVDKPTAPNAARHAAASHTASEAVGQMADGFTEDGILASGGHGGPADDDGGLTQRTCIRFIDGDTIELDGGERVRYIGIDTPETKHPRKPVQWMGQGCQRGEPHPRPR